MVELSVAIIIVNSIILVLVTYGFMCSDTEDKGINGTISRFTEYGHTWPTPI